MTELSTREEASVVSDTKAQVRDNIHGAKWILICTGLYISAFLYGLDTTIAADVQASAAETFGAISQVVWLGAGFPLGSVSIILLLGTIYGTFDQKWVYVASFLCFEIGSILCGAAPSMIALIVGRVIAGMGGAGIYLGALNYFSGLTTPKERGAYIAGIGLIWGLGCICGPLIGGAFSVSSATWRWAFYINAPIGGAFAPVYILFLPSKNIGTGSWRKGLTEVDWIGFVLSAGIWISFTLVLTFAGNTWRWYDGRTIATFAVFGVLLILFVIQQRVVLLYVVTSASISSLFVPVYYLPLYFQFVSGDSALLAAIRILPFICVFVLFNMAAGILLPRIGYYSAYYLIAGIFIIAGGAAFLTITAETSKSAIYGYSVLVAVGSGITCQIGYTIATVKASKISEQSAVDAISLQNLSQIGSTVICLVISGQIFQSLSFTKLSLVLEGYSEADIRSAIAGTSSAVFESLDSDLKAKVIDAVVSALANVFSLLVAAGGIMIISSLILRWERIAL